jgi:hypothetical protein
MAADEQHGFDELLGRRRYLGDWLGSWRRCDRWNRRLGLEWWNFRYFLARLGIEVPVPRQIDRKVNGCALGRHEVPFEKRKAFKPNSNRYGPVCGRKKIPVTNVPAHIRLNTIENAM